MGSLTHQEMVQAKREVPTPRQSVLGGSRAGLHYTSGDGSGETKVLNRHPVSPFFWGEGLGSLAHQETVQPKRKVLNRLQVSPFFFGGARFPRTSGDRPEETHGPASPPRQSFLPWFLLASFVLGVPHDKK